MMTRSLCSLVCLAALVILPLAGCTPPASEDVHGVDNVSTTGAGGLSPITTAGLDGAEPGLPIEIDVTPITTAGE